MNSSGKIDFIVSISCSDREGLSDLLHYLSESKYRWHVPSFSHSISDDNYGNYINSVLYQCLRGNLELAYLLHEEDWEVLDHRLREMGFSTNDAIGN